MGIVNVDTTDESAFSQRSFEPAPAGMYLCSIKSCPLVVEKAKSSSNNVINAHLVIEADGEGNDTEYKGRTIFNTIALTPKTEYMLTHLALCFGAMTAAEIKEVGGVDPDRFSTDLRGLVQVGIQAATEQWPTKNRVTRYMWEDAK